MYNRGFTKNIGASAARPFAIIHNTIVVRDFAAEEHRYYNTLKVILHIYSMYIFGLLQKVNVY
jgi:hypothetical protein